jgi:hypothetical protein
MHRHTICTSIIVAQHTTYTWDGPNNLFRIRGHISMEKKTSKKNLDEEKNFEGKKPT